MSAAAEEHHEEFESAGGAGASKTYPMQCSALRKGGHVVIKNRPCKIVDMSTSKTGKHGHAKVHLVAIDIFTGKKMEDLSPSTHNMDVPNVTVKQYQLLNVEGDFMQLMDLETSDTKEDIKVPDNEIGKEILAGFEEGKDVLCQITSAMGEEHCLSWRESPQSK